MSTMRRGLCILATAALVAFGLRPMRAAGEGTALGGLAALMQAGEWRELPTVDMVPTLDNLAGSSGVMTVYTDDMVWDPGGLQTFVIGADHLATQGPQWASYTATDNTWRRLTRPAWLSALTFFHGYDHTAMHQAARTLFHRPFGQNRVHRYDIATQSWTVLPIPSFPNHYANCCDALEYFPELNGLVWVRGSPGEVWLFHDGTQQWSRLGALPSGATWQQAEYSPVLQAVMFTIGGQFYLLSRTGHITALANTLSLYDGSGYNGVLTVDPVSGEFLALTPTTRVLYRYDLPADRWISHSSVGKPSLASLGVVATPVNTFGVILFAACTRNSCHAYLYKHSPSVPPQPPAAPSGFRVVRGA